MISVLTYNVNAQSFNGTHTILKPVEIIDDGYTLFTANGDIEIQFNTSGSLPPNGISIVNDDPNDVSKKTYLSYGGMNLLQGSFKIIKSITHISGTTYKVTINGDIFKREALKISNNNQDRFKQRLEFGLVLLHNDGISPNYISLQPSNNNHKPYLTYDNLAPQISIDQADQDIKKSIVEYNFTVEESNLKSIDINSYSLNFELTDGTYVKSLKPISITEIVTEEPARKEHEFLFQAPSTNGSFFEGENSLNYSLVVEDHGGNSSIKTGASNLKKSKIDISQELFEGYVKKNSVLEYSYTINEDGAVDEAFSEIILYDKLGAFVKSYSLSDRFSGTSFSFQFNNNVITDIGEKIKEGEKFNAVVTLYEEGNLSNKSIYSSLHYFDNTAPSDHTFESIEVVSTPDLLAGPTGTTWVDTPISDKTSNPYTTVKVNVNEYDLKKEGTKLSIDIFDENDDKLNVNAIEIDLTSFSKGSNSINELYFSFNLSEIYDGTSVKKVTYFKLNNVSVKDEAGNTGNHSFTEDTKYYFSSFAPSISRESIEYKQNEISIDINGELKNGDVTITVPYSAASLKNNIAIRVLGVDESQGNVTTIIEGADENQITFKITIDDTKFQSGSRLNYDLTIEDGSGNIVEEKNILGPEIKFDIPANFNVSYPKNPFSKWLVQTPEPTDNLVVEVVSNEENFRANELVVFENNEDGAELFRYIDENLNNTDTIYIEIPYSAIIDNISNPYLGELVLAYRTYNTSDQSINVPKRSIYLSDVADVELENDWYLFGYSAKNFGLKTNIDDNTKVNVFEYWPTTEIDNIISPINMWRDGDFTNDNDTRTVDLRVKAYDENSGISEDTVRFEVTQKSILDSQFKDFYCSNSQETSEFSINTIFVDADSNGTTLGLNLYRLENGDSVLVEVDEALVKINGEDSYTYRIYPSNIHDLPENRYNDFVIGLFREVSGDTLFLGYKNFKTIFEPEITTNLQMTFPEKGSTEFINVSLSEFNNRNYELSLLNEEDEDYVNITIPSISASNGKFRFRLENFTKDSIEFVLTAYTETGSCDIQETFTIPVTKAYDSITDEINISFENEDAWHTALLLADGNSVFIKDVLGGTKTPWDVENKQWQLADTVSRGLATISSPVYDLSAMDRPMIELDYIANTSERNGVFLQVKQGYAGAWKTVGTPEGIWNWYNTYGLYNNDLNTNNDGLAWAGALGAVEGRIPLDAALDMNGDLEKVMFRFVFAHGEGSTDSFGFERMKIRNRSRNVVIESYLQANNTGHQDILSKMYEILEVVNGNDPDFIHNYYLERSETCTDPIYDRGAETTEARRLWYGLNSINDETGPYSVAIDGELIEGTSIQEMSTPIYDAIRKSVLKDEPVTVDWTHTEDQLTIDYTIADTLFSKMDELLWVLTFGDAQEAIGACNPVNLMQRDFDQVIAHITPMIASDNSGRLQVDLTALPSGIHKEFNLQLLLQHYESMEIFSAISIPLEREGGPTSSEDLWENQWSIYPNPTSSTLNVQQLFGNEVDCTIYDIHGRTLFEGVIGHQTSITLDHFPKGVYIIGVSNNNKRFTKTFIKD
ncbi:T9SS type A sorting domain-containing protein [Flammeovirga sp. MY04]|uniref:T9SS type A sorting domain-containing protein n=1 Tax=Flammeovirga sp. MY04 TaxID=1191459 RepID=UPI0008062727|nr:T9SS type A sorting domain-containing protein [Flammeovirga sp. MY04]ANQ52279.1 T9SS type A sorting domain-containing protein [Flammeovirga sp. MY04]